MRDLTPSRRRFLSGGLVVAATAVAGCLDTAGERDDADRVLKLTLVRKDAPLRESFVVDLAQSERDWDEAAFEATRNGETYTTQHRTPFGSSAESPKYARHDGTYYRLGSVVVDEATATRPVLRLFEADGTADESTPDAVDADQLPAADQTAVRVGHFAARARGNEGGVPSGLVQRGGYVYRGEEAVDESELLAEDGPDRVTYRDTVYAVEISRERFHEPVYRATIEPVAETPERMEAIVRATFVDAQFSRDDLSTAARDVLRSARGDGYEETHPYSSGYEELLKAMHEQVYLDGNVERDGGVTEAGRRMIRYGETYYEYYLRFEPGVEDG